MNTHVKHFASHHWYDENRLLHRDADLPAVVRTDGTKEWFQHGERHRDNDLPAVERPDGSKEWYQHDKLHRDNDLPAIEYPSGSKEWFQHGKRHRDNGPAIERSDGTKEWYRYGRKMTKEEARITILEEHLVAVIDQISKLKEELVAAKSPLFKQ